MTLKYTGKYKTMVTTGMKRTAAIVCICYILIQSYQWWVFSLAPATSTPLSDFLFDGEPKSIVRSWLMLLSMFGLLYVHYILTYASPTRNRSAQGLTFTAFFTFFLLEVMLRSVELFYVQMQLPVDYVQGSATVRAGILAFVTQFRKIQGALYFPLGVSWMLASFTLARLYPSRPAFHNLIKIAFYFNGVRLLMRTATGYLGVNLFPDPIYDTLYLPMVFVVFGLSALWLFQSIRHERQCSEQTVKLYNNG
jgi:hypothetical protein